MTNSFRIQPSSDLSSVEPTVVAPPDAESQTLAMAIVEAAIDRKGEDIVVLDVSEVSYLADYFVIVTGFSTVQVRALARSIEDTVQEKLGRLPLQVEGQAKGSWMLMDYGTVIVHIFLPDEREFYNLEAFWGHAQRVSLTALKA